MAKFTSTTDHTLALTEIRIPKLGSKRVHLVGVKARVASDISLVTSTKLSASIKSAPFDGPKGIWVVDLTGSTNGKTSLKAKYKDASVASVTVEVFEKILRVLPLDDSIEGMFTRLFLAESINPGNARIYNATESRKPMLWMRKVIENRLSHKTPKIFSVKNKLGDPKFTVYDIVKAKNQFHGFENYPKVSSSIKINLDGFVAIANNYNHSKREIYDEFIQNSIAAANKDALKGFLDPSPNGLYGWRTKGSSAPGGDFKEYKPLAGQTFYTLKTNK